MKFPKPWTMNETGPTDEYIVLDANGRKLFYIKGDEGDPDAEGNPDPDIPPSALFWGSDAEHDALIDEILKMLQ